MSLPYPYLVIIILLGELNLPGINWSSLNPSCPTSGSLLNLISLSFLKQQSLNQPGTVIFLNYFMSGQNKTLYYCLRHFSLIV